VFEQRPNLIVAGDHGLREGAKQTEDVSAIAEVAERYLADDPWM
jgi:hypothetical protein